MDRGYKTQTIRNSEHGFCDGKQSLGYASHSSDASEHVSKTTSKKHNMSTAVSLTDQLPGRAKILTFAF
jgi:hypothetical protein